MTASTGSERNIRTPSLPDSAVSTRWPTDSSKALRTNNPGSSSSIQRMIAGLAFRSEDGGGAIQTLQLAGHGEAILTRHPVVDDDRVDRFGAEYPHTFASRQRREHAVANGLQQGFTNQQPRLFVVNTEDDSRLGLQIGRWGWRDSDASTRGPRRGHSYPPSSSRR